jgi:purine-binding chemotaxis protein CheW
MSSIPSPFQSSKSSSGSLVAVHATVPAADQDQYLTFQLGRETLAIAIQPIREILEYSAPTDVPMMPGHIRGVINLRGAVVPVVDLSARLGREDTVASRKTCIVIVETRQGEESQTFGVMVDAVHAVIDIAAADIEPPPPFGASIRNDFLEGLGKVNGKFVVILNMEQVLRSEDLAIAAGTGTVERMLEASSAANSQSLA